jgi:signal transduction histidine kinase
MSAATVLVFAVACALVAFAYARERRVGELVAQASHELRGPLSAARLGLHGLGEDDSARLAAIDLELRRAALALDDLSAAPRRRRAGEERAPVELGALLDEAGEAWRALAAARDVTLVVERPLGRVLVHADPLRLAQAFGNLAANAIEHGGGTVRVRVRAAPAGRARIEFTDAGPGLPAPVGELIAAARGRRARRGHGLALAAGIAERHGGRLTSAPSPAGARLVLELPCDAEPVSRDRPRGRRRRRRAR